MKPECQIAFTPLPLRGNDADLTNYGAIKWNKLKNEFARVIRLLFNE